MAQTIWLGIARYNEVENNNGFVRVSEYVVPNKDGILFEDSHKLTFSERKSLIEELINRPRKVK